jgi:hypothetical protein
MSGGKRNNAAANRVRNMRHSSAPKAKWIMAPPWRWPRASCVTETSIMAVRAS